MICSLVSIYFDSPQLFKSKLYKTLDDWSRDIDNFIFLEKDLRLVFPPCLEYDFSREMFLMLHSINWPNFLVWLPLCLEICSCYCTVPTAVWEIFFEFLIFCNLFHEPLRRISTRQNDQRFRREITTKLIRHETE